MQTENVETFMMKIKTEMTVVTSRLPKMIGEQQHACKTEAV
jgi:hypothetical protein